MNRRKYPITWSARLTDEDKLTILEIVIDQPSIYLRELQCKLAETTGAQVDVSTICRVLHATGFTKQKMDVCQSEKRGSAFNTSLICLCSEGTRK